MTKRETPTGTEPDARPPWVRAWDPMVALVGTDLSDRQIHWGADRIEAGTVRRFLEPIELGSLIHYDESVARHHGYDGLVAPSTSLISYSLPPMWSPGEPPLFSAADGDRDAQPSRSPVENPDASRIPPVRGFFATDMELDFLRPVIAGERLGRRGRRLLSCTPKETRVGRGAFCTYESEIVSDRGDVVARIRNGSYAYEPHPRHGGAE
ncbi:MaoC family dehydratase N-terminal domain-containing protein [Streptomyces sp. NPDC096311]|uniref:FAS1-like dehydratase domain-containing protein n=1 Tax=Streptomyces sp. NPDC096311 TaxID=3366083 RepID=UPI00380A8E8A